jgi:hypothetical protein
MHVSAAIRRAAVCLALFFAYSTSSKNSNIAGNVWKVVKSGGKTGDCMQLTYRFANAPVTVLRLALFWWPRSRLRILWRLRRALWRSRWPLRRPGWTGRRSGWTGRRSSNNGATNTWECSTEKRCSATHTASNRHYLANNISPPSLNLVIGLQAIEESGPDRVTASNSTSVNNVS